MLSLMDKAAIIKLHENGYSQRRIAKDLDLSRNTVSKCISLYEKDRALLAKTTDEIEISIIQERMLSASKMDVSKRKPNKFTGKLKERFLELLKIDEERYSVLGPNKQNATAASIYRQLIKEKFEISSSRVRYYCNLYKNKNKEVYIKQFYEYGLRVEFDFHQIKLEINGKVKTFHQATISCPASNFIFIRLFDNEKTASVFRGLIEFFRYAGGVPEEVVFDNLKPVVKVYGYKNKKQLTDEIIKFSAYYGFNVITCNARRGNEKGHVENSGKYTRGELFSLHYKFKNMDELNAYINEKMLEINEKSLMEFEKEKEKYHSLPIHDYTIGDFGLVRVDSKYSYALVGTNYYSIPEEYVGEDVRYTIINDVIVFYKNTKELCRHKKIDGTNSYSLNIHHYLKTLYKKPGAVAHSLALRQASEEIVSIYTKKYKENPKGFIEYLFGNNEKSTNENDVESTALQQLCQINEVYLLGEKNNG